MKRQVRRGVFETNSSSTHSLTMCLKSDYDRWTNGEVLLFKGSGWCYDENNKPLKNHFYTKEECINFVKSSKCPPSDDMDWEDEDSVTEYFRENDFYDGEYTDDELEWFEDEFITPSGEKVIAFGGYPDLIPFLHKLKEKKVIVNMTVNQIHFQRRQELIKKLVSEKLIYGLGVSLVNPTEEFISLIQEYPNAVIHVINGILKPSDIEVLKDKNLKMLILGYKELRRGNDWFAEDHENISVKQMWLKENLQSIVEKFKIVSFDNLAIEQLDVKRLMRQEEWDEFYMGEDGTMTFYIDMVERKFARSSTASFDKRYELLDTVDDMFKHNI